MRIRLKNEQKLFFKFYIFKFNGYQTIETRNKLINSDLSAF